MARVELAPEVLDDSDRFFKNIVRFEVEDASARIDGIVQAIQILVHSPLMGRLVKGGLRELLIGRDTHGYVALYRFVSNLDMVFVLAIRSQREAGYTRDS